MLLLLWPYYPEAQYALQQPSVDNAADAASSSPSTDSTPGAHYAKKELGCSNHLLIPKISVSACINEGEDESVLDREEGVWHQAGTPGGNIVLAGHRFRWLPPNTQTLYHLDKLEAGDELNVFLDGKRYLYLVSGKERVKSDRIDILESTQVPRLTLYTCTDLAATERLVVRAELRLE